MTPSYAFAPDELVGFVVDKMADLEFDGSSKEWTGLLKQSFHQSYSKEMDVLFSHTETDNHEFLLDMAVWDRHEGEGLVLAMESEWIQSREEIERDFWKLLVVKSYTKLMVFALNKKPRKHTPAAIWLMLSDCLLKYKHHIKGERYVFIDFAPVPARSAWWIEIPEDGPLKVVPARHKISLQPTNHLL